MIYKISTIKNKTDRLPVDQFLNYTQLHHLFTTFIESEKNNAPAFIDGHFGGKERLTKNLNSKSFIILDIDKFNGTIEVLENLLTKQLGEYKYLAYSTASYTASFPRIRLILFLKHEITPSIYTDVAINFIDTLDASLKDAIDIISSTTINKIMYLPIISHKEYKSWVWNNEGIEIEPAIYDFKNQGSIINSQENGISNELDPLLKIAIHQPLQNLTDEKIINYLKNYPANQTDHDEWFSVGLALHHQYQGKPKGLILWDKWSRVDTRIKPTGELYYPGKDHLRSRWESIHQKTDSVLTFATIIRRIKNNISETTLPISSEKWINTRGKANTPLFTLDNFHVLLKEYKIVIKFDVIKKEQLIFFDGQREPNTNSAITHIKLLCILNTLPYTLVNEMVNKISLTNKINTWRDWIESKKWDGINRLEEFYNTLDVLPEYRNIRNIYLRKWLLQMIHSTCLNDDNHPKMARMVLTFQGHSSIGKTSWVAALAPDKMYDYAATGIILDANKDTNIKKCIEHVIVELGEIASTYRKSDIDALKNFISSHTDIIDIKYIARAEKFRRMTVFCATVNEMNFLQDQTGNTRFLCLPVLNCNAFHNIDLQQLYVQLLEYAISNPTEEYNLSPEEREIQTMLNYEMESISPLEESLIAIFDMQNPNHDKKHTATEILLQIGFSRPQINKKHTNEMARILDKRGLKRCHHPKGWYLPPKLISHEEF